MRHTITFEEMTAYLNQESWVMAACSSSAKSHKRIDASNKGMFRVKDGDEITYEGPSLGAAVDAYNAAQ